MSKSITGSCLVRAQSNPNCLLIPFLWPAVRVDFLKKFSERVSLSNLHGYAAHFRSGLPTGVLVELLFLIVFK